MIATALHSIATGNLLPAWVKVVCVDINPATVTKLTDRGTFQTVGLVTRNGVESGPGGMNYEHDMPPYVQEMADWLDDDDKPHPLRFERAFHGLEIMSALYRSAIEGGQIALPLTTGMNELDGLRDSVPDRRVLMTLADSANEYKE